MSARLAFYVVEAALLASIVAGCLALTGQALRRFGAPVRIPHGRVWLGAWLAFAGIGIVFGEAVGPEFVLPYHFCFWLAVGSLLAWLLSFASRGAPKGGSRRNPETLGARDSR